MQIRPIDKKQQYQFQMLMNVTENAMEGAVPSEEESVAPTKGEDLSKYRPNPDMLVNKSDITSHVRECNNLGRLMLFSYLTSF